MIGIFDSGVGGLSVFREIRKLLPDEKYIYFSDSAHCPYGEKSRDYIIDRARQIASFLISQGAEIIVVACNTATAAAIDHLRGKYRDVPFVGIEPAVKPAALNSKSAVVAVLATEGTFNGRLYRETVEKFAAGVTVIASVADEFVTMVERGETEGPGAEAAVRRRLEPLLAAGADHIVLGCTHFPHLKKTMEKVVAGRAALVDPAEAVAMQAKRVLAAKGLEAGGVRCRGRLIADIVRR
jgi:glutamate racemase